MKINKKKSFLFLKKKIHFDCYQLYLIDYLNVKHGIACIYNSINAKLNKLESLRELLQSL